MRSTGRRWVVLVRYVRSTFSHTYPLMRVFFTERLHAHISEVLETMLTSKQDETSSSMS